MTIEERVRRMLVEAVASEPAPSGAPFERAVRRRRRRPLRAVAVAAALLLAVAVVLTGVRVLGTKPAPLPTVTPAVPSDWKTYQNDFYNLKLRYPPDWVVQTQGGVAIIPRRFAGPGITAAGSRPFIIGVALSAEYYLFVVQNGAQVTRGTQLDGRASIRFSSVQGRIHIVQYEIDMGRFCLSGNRDCGAKSATAAVEATSQATLDRYGKVAEQIVRTFQPLRPTTPSAGNPARPACRPEQWRPAFSSQSKTADEPPGGLVIAGDIRYLRGPACHLRTTVRLTVEQADGTPVTVPGTPSPFTVQTDLPEDNISSDLPRGASMWFWAWDNWCRQPLASAHLRVTADNGASTTRPLPPRSIQDRHFPCRPNAPWRVVPLP